MAYDAKNQEVAGRQLEVQKVVIPLVLVGNTTAASVSMTSDEPALLYFRSQSVDQITPALAANETASFVVASSDAGGTVQCLLQIKENLVKVCSASLRNQVGSSSGMTAYVGDGNANHGITTGSGGGQSIMLILTTGVSLQSATTSQLCLEVEYIAAE